MTYKLQFLPSALKEWRKLADPVRSQLKKKLAQRLEQPCIAKSRLSGFRNHYKIKLKSVGYRLVYEVIDKDLTVLVIAVGKREKGVVYQQAIKRKMTN